MPKIKLITEPLRFVLASYTYIVYHSSEMYPVPYNDTVCHFSGIYIGLVKHHSYCYSKGVSVINVYLV